MELGKDDEAVETLHAARAAGCRAPELFHEQAAALAKLGRLDEAIQAALDGVAAFPRSPENRLQLGQLQIQNGEHAAAEATLRNVLADGLLSAPLVFALATACERQDKREEAARFREQFSDLKAKQAAAKPPFQEVYDRELVSIATRSITQAAAVYDHHNESGQAQRLLLRAYALDPRNATVCGDLVAMFRHAGRIADARLVQQRLAQIEPQNVTQHLNLASLSAQLGDYQPAEASLQEVIRLRPDLASGYASLAQLYLQMDKPDQARWFGEAALKQLATPEEAARTCLVLAEACQRLGDRAAAEAALAQARKLAPNPPPAE
jgi:tetratricopeptide (TPR) repeat protein